MTINTFVKSILSTIAITHISSLNNPNGILSFVVLILLCVFYSNNKPDKKQTTKLCSIVFAILGLLSVFQVNQFEDNLANISQLLFVVRVAVVFIGVYLFMNSLISYIYKVFDNILIKKDSRISSKKMFVVSFVVLTLMYIPVWLMEYPSNISPDTISQIWQIINNSFTNHHPFAHTMWLKTIMSIGNDINTKIGIASLVQLIINALVFSVVIKVIHEKIRNTYISISCLCFYALYSFHSFFSITLIKDVTHATITCLFLLAILYYFDCKETKPIKYIFLFLTSIGFCLFRSNGYYAFVIVLLISLLYAFRSKKYKLFVLMVLAFLSSTLIKGPLYAALNVSDASYVESLSIPIQQISRVISRGGVISNQQKEMLNRIVDTSQIKDNYDIFLSDPIKNMINSFGKVDYLQNNKLDYFKLWLEIGIKNPLMYISAWVDQISTFISPRYYATSIFWTVSENNLGVVGSPLLITGNLNNTLHMLAYKQHNIPIFGWLHYPSISTWIMLIMLFYSIDNKNSKAIIMISSLLGIWLTILISCPYNLCFRYFYSVVCCLPLIVLIPFIKYYE